LRLEIAALLTMTVAAIAPRAAEANWLVSLRGPYFTGTANQIAYVTDNGTILDLDYIPGGLGGLNGPSGMQFNADGDLIVASAFSDQILAYDLQSGASLGTFAPTVGAPPVPPFFGPNGIRFDGTGRLLVANSGSAFTTIPFDGTIVTGLDEDTGDFVGNFGAGHFGPTTIAIDGPDYYVSELTASMVLKFDAAGNFQQMISDASIVGASAVTIDPATGDVLISSVFTDKIVRFDGTNYSTFQELPAGFFPGGVTFIDNDTFLVASTAVGTILQYDVGNPVPSVFASFIELDMTNGVSIGDMLYTDFLPGDLNDDGWVDIFDVGVASENWMDTGAPGIPGDANYDGVVDIFDVGRISEFWYPPVVEVVPEPSTIGLAIVGLASLGVAGVRRKRRGG
jgi:hypothetical protein